jgi:hypothetical protein
MTLPTREDGGIDWESIKAGIVTKTRGEEIVRDYTIYMMKLAVAHTIERCAKEASSYLALSGACSDSLCDSTEAAIRKLEV